MAGFRRPTFSIGQEIPVAINDFDDASTQRQKLDEQVFDEVLLFFVLAPFASLNLRAPCRPVISVTDASE